MVDGFDDEGLSAGAVARRLGIAVTTLRTWHQRYGLGPGGHAPGHHRRYDAEDLRRLETMRRLTAHGVPAAEAARIALATPAEAEPEAPRQQRDGGGHTVAVGRAGAQARGLARAAMRLDALTVRDLVDQAVAEHGVVATWQDLLCPVLVGIGTRHAATSRLIEVEHLVSRCVTEVFGAVPRPVPGTPVPVLLACADDEQHSLPLEALSAALAERGIGSRLLGARVPARSLLDAVRRTGPALVLVWSHAPQTADTGVLSDLLTMPGRPALVVAAGPGWPEEMPDGVLTPDSLTAALTLATSV